MISNTLKHNQLLFSLVAKSATPTFRRLASTSTNHHIDSSHSAKSNLFDISTKIYNEEDGRMQDDTKFITHALYPHPSFTPEGCKDIEITHREPRTFGDKMSFYGTKYARLLFDFFTGYKELKTGDSYEYKGTRYFMNDSKFLTRCLFLESIAACPPSCASFIRTLHSVRLLRRDKAWIETLSDEAYNERMHLLTFIKIGKPSWFTRSMIYIGQGVFTNLFFLAYLVNPRYCHRFVGYLEEEAVKTYTHLLDDLSIKGRLPQLEKTKVPKIAQQYWSELNENSTFEDLILRIRADEAKHREVNHTFANLERTDRNPFALQIEDSEIPQPNSGLKITRPTGWERKDLYL